MGVKYQEILKGGDAYVCVKKLNLGFLFKEFLILYPKIIGD